jgi:hypothetical protein
MWPHSVTLSTQLMISSVTGLLKMDPNRWFKIFLVNCHLDLVHLTGMVLLITMNTMTFSEIASTTGLLNCRGFSELQIMNGLLLSFIKLAINLAVLRYWSLKVSIKELLAPLFQSIGIKIKMEIIKKTLLLSFSN